MKNRVIVFANQKGGVGKSTLCVLMAHWLHQQCKRVIVYDADIQQSLVDRRRDELEVNPSATEPWEIRKLDTMDFDATQKELADAAQYDGYVLIDAPGFAALPGMAPVLQIADAVVVPFGYEYSVLQSTIKFLKVLLSEAIGQDKNSIFLVPNLVEDHIGTQQEKQQMEEDKKQLEKVCRVTYRVKKGVAVQRLSTLTVTSYQMKATMGPWTTITNKIK